MPNLLDANRLPLWLLLILWGGFVLRWDVLPSVYKIAAMV